MVGMLYLGQVSRLTRHVYGLMFECCGGVQDVFCLAWKACDVQEG